jgi:hypothetical protein
MQMRLAIQQTEWGDSVSRRNIISYRVYKSFNFHGRVFRVGQVISFTEKNGSRYEAEGVLVKLGNLRAVDIFKSGLKFPDEIVINGSGPNGKNEYDRMGGKFVISLNKAILTPVKSAIWGAQDPTLPREKYFIAKADALAKTGKKFGVKEFDAGHYPVPVFERTRVAKYFPVCRVTFNLSSYGLVEKKMNLKFQILYRGATVCGTFIQIAHWLGVKRIVLNGIDMFGSKYFDDTTNRSAGNKKGVWNQTKRMQALIDMLETQGMEFYTLSKTILDVPLIKRGEMGY